MKIIDYTSCKEEEKYLPSENMIDQLHAIPKWVAVYCFCPTVTDKNRQLNFDQCFEALMDIYHRIPVCLVTRNMIGKTIDVRFGNFTETVLVPSPIDKDIIDSTCNGNVMEEQPSNDDRTESDSQSITPKENAIKDALGVYVRREANLIHSRQVIFLYADSILQTAGQEHYDSLFGLVALHEMMHALLDPDVETESEIQRSKNYLLMKSSMSYFHQCEEAIANAMAVLCLFYFSDDQRFITDFVRAQPRPYCQVPEVARSKQRLLMNASNWLLFKTKYNHHKKRLKSPHIRIPYIVRHDQFAGLTSFIIPAGETVISTAFLRCFTDLQTVSIPEGVKEIQDFAIGNCGKIKEIVFPASLEKLAGNALDSNGLEQIYVNEGNRTYESRQNCVLRKDNGELVMGCSSSIIPEDCCTIGEYAFCGSRIEAVNLPSKIREIKHSAFLNCESLQTVVVPDSVISIDDYAFYSCGSLKRITLMGTPVLRYQCFAQCRKLKIVSGLSKRTIRADKNAFFVSDDEVVFDLCGNIEMFEDVSSLDE